jgi:acyl-CoA synthetase (AMP-forming)/AMP-acid ligase II
LVARGPTVMKGYWKNPELTAEVLKDGWFHSRDMGYRDEDGYFYLAGRRDDVIIKGGENIYPQEIENVLEAHPKISEAGVVGVPDKAMGEEVKAFIVLQTREKMTEDEIISYCRDHLGKFKVAKYVEFVDALPRSSVGKVLRTELRRPARLEGKKLISPIEDTL